jgi:hypothetical protein
LVFPAFAKEFLDFDVGLNLAAEHGGEGGKPDFTPADRVTHRFVFETKGSSDGAVLTGHESQVRGYLSQELTDEVVLTNVAGIIVYRLLPGDQLDVALRVNLRELARLYPDQVAHSENAQRFARFVERFHRRQLTTAEKIERVRSSPPWDADTRFTDHDWLRARIQSVVEIVQIDVHDQIDRGALSDPTMLTGEQRAAVLDELRNLAVRLQVEPVEAEGLSLQDFLSAPEGSARAKTLIQYEAYVAYWLTTKLVLVRIWEDLGLINPASLYDGGFDERMSGFGDRVLDVIDFAFRRAEERYKALFAEKPTYSWFRPANQVAVDAIYELATTYFGDVRSDLLGRVYEGTLQRIDRKLLGQYYTPRDVIGLIWDLVLTMEFEARLDTQAREPRVLDIAAGSGGFLVEGVARRRARIEEAIAKGAIVDLQQWTNDTVEGFNGIELQRFSAFLAELNLLIQFSHPLAADPGMRLPELGIVPADTLSLHGPRVGRFDTDVSEPTQLVDGDYIDAEERLERARRIKDPQAFDSWFDVAIGNPPYIGEKIGSELWASARRRWPYWDDFAAPHVDYLYGFLIVGVSKLRPGGRFGFITTEYWLRSIGAKHLRKYLADRCRVERLILFRDLRLFPDAPGQHSMVIVGERVADEEHLGTVRNGPPRVSVYEGPNLGVDQRSHVLAAMTKARTLPTLGLRSFVGGAIPHELGGESWAEVVLTRAEVLKRAKVRSLPQLEELDVAEGVIATANTLTGGADSHIPQPVLAELGWPGTKPGVFSLSPEEVSSLGELNEAERAVLRQVVNTADVYPYAVVVRDGARSLLYLPQPEDTGSAEREAVVNWPFPEGLPRIQAHLTKFRPWLVAKVEGFGEKRPWWSLHRARAAIVEQPGERDWSDYVVTTRWGGGARLIVGLAPKGTVPSSGLHVLRVKGGAHNAAYVAALYNSTMFQDVAASLPPGQIKAEELEGLGLPDPGEEKRLGMSTAAIEQAALVTRMVRELGPVFPTLCDDLRSDVALTDVDDRVWVPAINAGPSWGTVASVTWIEQRLAHGSQNRRAMEVAVEREIGGWTVLVTGRTGLSESTLRLYVGLDGTVEEAEALAAYVRGVAIGRQTLRQVLTIAVPIDRRTLATSYGIARDELTRSVDEYRARRSTIDRLLED